MRVQCQAASGRTGNATKAEWAEGRVSLNVWGARRAMQQGMALSVATTPEQAGGTGGRSAESGTAHGRGRTAKAQSSGNARMRMSMCVRGERTQACESEVITGP